MTGWSLKRIQYEAFRREWEGFGDPSRYHPLRDGKREHDWEWAVDRLAVRLEISSAQRSAARQYYEARQVIAGDIAPERTGMGLGRDDGETRQERARRIAKGATAYVLGHPDLTAARKRVFEKLFQPSQPTLEQIRTNGKTRLNQRETIDRIRWCCEVLANHFDGQPYPEGKMNEKHMGVGEGWARYEYTGSIADAASALERQGLQTFVSPSGNLYARNPHAASVFQPIDQSPQITP